MTATVVYDLDKIQDKHEFMLSMRANEYVSLLINFGYKLHDLNEKGADIAEAILLYQSMLSSSGIIYQADGNGEEPLL